jgi:hypothetical protein
MLLTKLIVLLKLLDTTEELIMLPMKSVNPQLKSQPFLLKSNNWNQKSKTFKFNWEFSMIKRNN